MRNKFGLAAALALLAFFASGFAAPMALAQEKGEALPPASLEGPEDHILGPGDRISISIFGDPELSQSDVRINGQGNITLPLVKEVKAGGKTALELQSAIAEAYKSGHFLKDPQVTVVIREVRSSPVTVAGAVAKASRLQMQGRVTLLQAITEAGSFHDAGSKVIIDRPAHVVGGTQVGPQVIVIQVKDLQMKPGDPTVNIDLQAGDIVTVSPAEFVFVGGAVGKPGKLAMNEVPNWSILSALAAVGNVTKVAKMEHSVILRAGPNGTTTEIPVNIKKVLERKDPDVKLTANDIVLVPESPGRKALYAAGQTLSTTSAVLLGTLHP
jgi:polysaccharide export outer membrane protein